ncbi:hypothetical protein CAPTEDRAFT_215857 [Capitella teleta]|uniref:Endonuclease/exonuclease/phosphatase domain-containing protein n=1 Tax=Capitella teleta TaxID=283909 RepID=R7U5Q4_CAPTE|nr:hypothetical protein CAPTEDRAFT_215857 [Capitella teleta]|eukprot:ELU01309.1 hypothetical protein CAPTEDRAFT_215857 [Capitella teleta]
MDGVENENGRIMRSLVESSELDIMNVIWPGLEGPTWERKTSSYCLDYVFLNNAGLNLIKDSWKLGYDELVESDHKAICVSIGWKAAKKDNKKRRKHQRLQNDQIIEYRERVEERAMEERSLQKIMDLTQFIIDDCLTQRSADVVLLDLDGGEWTMLDKLLEKYGISKIKQIVLVANFDQLFDRLNGY